MHNPVSTLIYSSGNRNVELVMVDGRILLEEGRLTMMDEGIVADQIQRFADDLSIKAGTFTLKKRPWKSI